MTDTKTTKQNALPEVTWDTYVDLGKPAGVAVVPASRIGTDDTYVCSSYVMGAPLIMPGNRIKSCAVCGVLIQMRPHAPERARKVCVPCALSEGFRLPDGPVG
jgi:hypothetical protein